MKPDRLSIPGYDEVWRLDCAGAVAFVSLHAVIQGRSLGGVRIRGYPSENDALADERLWRLREATLNRP